MPIPNKYTQYTQIYYVNKNFYFGCDYIMCYISQFLLMHVDIALVLKLVSRMVNYYWHWYRDHPSINLYYLYI